MLTFYIIIGTLILAIVTFALYRLIVVKQKTNRLNKQKFERIQPLYQALENGGVVTAAMVLPYASNLRTREQTYHLLTSVQELHLFPEEYNTIIKAAEANLACWLEFPTELDAIPDEIEHIKRVTIPFDEEGNVVHYEVFKYCTHEPHWSAKNGWSLGVVGPYFDDSKPYDHPHATFSRISSSANNMSPEDEAEWVHKNIGLRR